jgi:hypothetical protein
MDKSKLFGQQLQLDAPGLTAQRPADVKSQQVTPERKEPTRIPLDDYPVAFWGEP